VTHGQTLYGGQSQRVYPPTDGTETLPLVFALRYIFFWTSGQKDGIYKENGELFLKITGCFLRDLEVRAEC
jgi:hypothetical protein